MDASLLAQPLPLQVGPPATPEEMQNRTQQWLQVIQSPTVQQELQKYKAMQGLMGFGTRMTQNLGMGVPGTAAFGNAVGHGMDVMNDIDQQMLKNSMGIAKQQSGEDEARMQRMQVGQQQTETGRHNLATEKEAARYHDILGGYYSKLGAAAGGGGAGTKQLSLKDRAEMWQTALDGCGGDPRCAATQLATQLMGIMTREEAMAQFPQLRPGALGAAPGPQMSPTAEKPGFFSRVGSGIVDWASRNIVEPTMTPSAPAPSAPQAAQAPAPSAMPPAASQAGPAPMIPGRPGIAPAPFTGTGELPGAIMGNFGVGSKTLMDLMLEARTNGVLPQLSLQQLTEMQRNGLATPEQVKMYLEMLGARQGIRMPSTPLQAR